jgi:NADH-quinone oxidoreductase subunit J
MADLPTLTLMPVTLADALFYAFAVVMLFAAIMVITARNPVHSVLFLILAFFNAASLFLLAGAEFLAMLLVIVYVGAVAVLFLFVVMMLDVDFKKLRAGFVRQLPIALIVAGIFAFELVLLALGWRAGAASNSLKPVGTSDVTNTEAIGHVLYTDYIVPFQLAGMVLLVAMVGAIVLTLRDREGVRRQSVTDQVARKASDVLRINKVKSREGV